MLNSMMTGPVSWLFLDSTMGFSLWQLLNEGVEWMNRLLISEFKVEYFYCLPNASVSRSFFSSLAFAKSSKEVIWFHPLCPQSGGLTDILRELFIWNFFGFSGQEQREMGPSFSWLNQQKRILRQKMNIDPVQQLEGKSIEHHQQHQTCVSRCLQGWIGWAAFISFLFS